MHDQDSERHSGFGGENLTGDRLIALFLVAAALFHPLLIGLFDRGSGAFIFGVPLLYAYLFAAWAALIAALALVIERSLRAPHQGGEGAGAAGGRRPALED
jgi:hypothetical protein